MKQDLRKKVKLTVWITPNDLLLFEDYLDCVPLCSKHKSAIIQDNQDTTDGQLDIMHYKCKECEKVWKKWRAAAMRIASQLYKYYDRFEVK